MVIVTIQQKCFLVFRKSRNSKGLKSFNHAVAIGEAKKWDFPLDGKSMDSNPSFQTVKYMNLTGKDWGILTNGRLWRLYSLKSESRYETYPSDQSLDTRLCGI